MEYSSTLQTVSRVIVRIILAVMNKVNFKSYWSSKVAKCTSQPVMQVYVRLANCSYAS